MKRIRQAIKSLSPIQCRMVLIIYSIRGEESALELAMKFRGRVRGRERGVK
jgi:hypothetical protein